MDAGGAMKFYEEVPKEDGKYWVVLKSTMKVRVGTLECLESPWVLLSDTDADYRGQEFYWGDRWVTPEVKLVVLPTKSV